MVGSSLCLVDCSSLDSTAIYLQFDTVKRWPYHITWFNTWTHLCYQNASSVFRMQRARCFTHERLDCIIGVITYQISRCAFQMWWSRVFYNINCDELFAFFKKHSSMIFVILLRVKFEDLNSGFWIHSLHVNNAFLKTTAKLRVVSSILNYVQHV